MLPENKKAADRPAALRRVLENLQCQAPKVKRLCQPIQRRLTVLLALDQQTWS